MVLQQFLGLVTVYLIVKLSTYPQEHTPLQLSTTYRVYLSIDEPTQLVATPSWWHA